MNRYSILVLVAVFAAGCGVSDSTTITNTKKEIKIDLAAQSDGLKYRLASAPGGAKSVLEVRKNAKDGDTVVVVGRVGGSAEPLTDGRAVFHIADTSLKPTEGCETPWDFCEYPKDEVAAARLTVKFVDESGKTLGHGARQMFGLKELTTVVVKGKVNRDDNGNVVVLASGIHVREAKE